MHASRRTSELDLPQHVENFMIDKATTPQTLRSRREEKRCAIMIVNSVGYQHQMGLASKSLKYSLSRVSAVDLFTSKFLFRKRSYLQSEVF